MELDPPNRFTRRFKAPLLNREKLYNRAF